MRHEMNLEYPFEHVFRRAVGLFPAPSVTLEAAGRSWRADGFCAVSFKPAVVALAFAGLEPDLPAGPFTIAANGVTLQGSPLESRTIGDHTMLLASVDAVALRGGEPAVSWRRASFGLRLNYPFLETPASLAKFVDDWRTGVLP